MSLWKRSPFSRALFWCALMLTLRAGMRFFYADFWAEDGAIYLKEGLELGWASLLEPFGGYYHTLQRTFTLLMVRVFPVTWWPHAVTLFCAAIFVFVSAVFARTTYRWLMPSDKQRIFVSVLLVLAPGLFEITGNLANLNWVLIMWAGLVCLKDPTESVSPWEIFGFVVVILSTGTSFTLFPLVIFRLWNKRTSGLLNAQEVALGLVLILGIGLQMARFTTGDRGAGKFAPGRTVEVTKEQVLEKGPISYVMYVVRSGLLRPWLGPGLANKWTALIPATAWMGALLFFLLIAGSLYWLSRGPSKASQAVFWFTVGISTWCLAALIARPYAINSFIEGGYFSGRYAFPLGFAVTLFWAVILGPKVPFVGKRPTILGLFYVLYFLHGLDRFLIHPHSPPPHSETRVWNKLSPGLMKSYRTGCPSQYVIPIYPESWQVDYRSGREDCSRELPSS